MISKKQNQTPDEKHPYHTRGSHREHRARSKENSKEQNRFSKLPLKKSILVAFLIWMNFEICSPNTEAFKHMSRCFSRFIHSQSTVFTYGRCRFQTLTQMRDNGMFLRIFCFLKQSSPPKNKQTGKHNFFFFFFTEKQTTVWLKPRHPGPCARGCHKREATEQKGRLSTHMHTLTQALTHSHTLTYTRRHTHEKTLMTVFSPLSQLLDGSGKPLGFGRGREDKKQKEPPESVQ